MRALISEFMGTVFEDFRREINGQCLCELKQSRYDGCHFPDYSIKKEQQYYLLRYFPAYLCEYKYIYRQVVAERKLEQLDILSIGCGAGIDYLGLYLALGKTTTNITYRGIDIISWSYQNNLGNENYRIETKNIAGIEYDNPCEINIIIFPKSLSEIQQDDFNVFVEKLRDVQFASPFLYLISSTMDSGFRHDERRYLSIFEALKATGYSCTKYRPTMAIKDKPAYAKVDHGFKYPDEIIDYLIELNEKCPTYVTNGGNCETACREQLSRKPILNSTYFSYQINRLEK